MNDQPQLLHSRTFLQALIDADVIRLGDRIRRVVIDADFENLISVYVERIGDERLLSVVQTLNGVEISGVPAPVDATPQT